MQDKLIETKLEEIKKEEPKKEEPKKEEIKDMKQERINKCTEEMKKILDEYGCTLTCYFIITAKGNVPKIEVISK